MFMIKDGMMSRVWQLQAEYDKKFMTVYKQPGFHANFRLHE